MNTQAAVRSQYLAALKMLKEAIVKCPPRVWDALHDKDKFWFKAQHTLYWTHHYLRAADKRLVPWKRHRRPDADAPVSKPELLQYLTFIEKQLTGPEATSGFNGSEMNKLEFHITNIRHIQQHTGELYERLGSRENITLHWTERVHRNAK